MHCSQQTKFINYYLSFNSNFNKAIAEYAWKKEWEVNSKVRHGKVRGYTGINLRTRPRRQPSVEFGARIMLKRIQHYMSLNIKPNPPIEVSSLYIDFQPLTFIRISLCIYTEKNKMLSIIFSSIVA